MRKLVRNLFVAAACSALLYSCAPDEEETTVTPENPKTKFIGSWTCQETAGANPSTYTIHITDSAGSWVLIENLYATGFQNKVKATINTTSLSIAQQQIGSTSYQVNGSGSLVNNTTIGMSFNVFDGATTDSVTATCTKQ